MNTDIRIKTTLPRHWKYRKLKRLIGESPMEYLVCFWVTVAEQKPNGALNGWSTDDIEQSAEWHGDHGKFCSAMIESGFLDEIDGGFYPHDWEENQPWACSSEARSDAARKAGRASAKKRAQKKQLVATDLNGALNGNEQNVDESLASGSATPSPSPSPSPIDSCGSKPRQTRMKKSHPSKQTIFFRWWDSAYLLATGTPYVRSNHGKEGKLFKTIEQVESNIVIGKALTFLSSDDEWLDGKRDFSMFVSQFNRMKIFSDEAGIRDLRENELLPPEGEMLDGWLGVKYAA